MERGKRGRGEMDDQFNPYRTNTSAGKKVEIINGYGNGNVVNRVCVVRSNPPLPDPYRSFNVSKSPLPKRASNSQNSLLSGRELKRRKRVAKYKWYAIEGRVKASLKNGYRWFTRRCSRLVHGV